MRRTSKWIILASLVAASAAATAHAQTSLTGSSMVMDSGGSATKIQRGTRVRRNTLCTVEELIRPRPARSAISRIDGRPARECRLSKPSKRSAIGPDGTGSRLIDPTPCHPPGLIMSKFVKLSNIFNILQMFGSQIYYTLV